MVHHFDAQCADMVFMTERHDLLDWRAYRRMRRDADSPGQHRGVGVGKRYPDARDEQRQQTSDQQRPTTEAV